MAKNRKPSQDLLLPGASGWERWTGTEGESCTLAAGFGQSAGVFAKDSSARLLALPAAHLWVLPAWLQGDAAHLRDMAGLHLERLGVRVTDLNHGLHVRQIAAREGAFLVCMVALKEAATPLWDTTRLPGDVVLSADCLPVPSDTMVIFRELGKLVLVITHGPHVMYASPLSAHELDDHALGEINHLCLQLGFQAVLGQIRHIILWLEDEGDLDHIQRVTGLSAVREPRPAPVMPARGTSPLMPPEIMAARAQQARATRTRLLALTAGFAVAAAIAVMAVLISSATQGRDLLRDRVAELSPRASQVLDQKKSWIEAAPAVDPTLSGMQVLLDSMEPTSSGEVSITHFEWTPDRLMLRGRTPSPSVALQYAKEITEVTGLNRYVWETPAPTIASDGSATFEVKGGPRP